MTHVHWLEHSSAVWKALETMFASISQSKITNLRVALATTKRLNDPAPVFLAKIQTIADDLAAAGRPVPEDEHVSFIMAGLGPRYESVIAAYGVLKQTPSLSDLYAQVQAYHERQVLQHGHDTGGFETSANAAMRQNRQPQNAGYYGGGRGAPREDRRDRREDRRDDRRGNRQPQQGRGGGRAPPGGVVDGDAVASARRRGSTSPVRSATGKAIQLKTAGISSKTMMMITSTTKRPMRPPTVLIPIGILTPAPLTTSLES
jgi:hypothetical protein